MFKSIGIRTKAFLEAALISLVFTSLLGFSTLLVYNKSLETLDEEIKIGLMSIVQSAATVLDGDLHQTFNADTPLNDPQYLAQAQLLENMRLASRDVRYAYTNILVDDKIYFILNISPQNDADNDGIADAPPALMAPYDEGFAPELMTALKERRTTVSKEQYQDQWGTFISAYAPMYNSKNEFIGTVGMDLELAQFFERLEKIEVVFEKASITILFLGLVIGLLVWSLRRSQQDNVVRLQLLSQTNTESNQYFQVFLAIFTRLSDRLADAYKNNQIDKELYLKQLETTNICCNSYFSSNNETVTGFNLNEWQQSLQQRVEYLGSITQQMDNSLPEFATGKQALLTDFFVQLLTSLKALKSTELTLSHTCLNEGLRDWTVLSTIKFDANTQLYTAARVLCGHDLSEQFKHTGALSIEELALINILRVRNLMPMLNVTATYDEGSIRVLWLLGKQDIDTE